MMDNRCSAIKLPYNEDSGVKAQLSLEQRHHNN